MDDNKMWPDGFSGISFSLSSEQICLDDFKKANVFISGPVTGKDRSYVDRIFGEAHRLLKSLEVEYVGMPNRLIPQDATHESAMRESIHDLTKRTYDRRMGETTMELYRHNFYQYILMLPGWTLSKGCLVEARVACACGIKRIEYEDLLREVCNQK